MIVSAVSSLSRKAKEHKKMCWYPLEMWKYYILNIIIVSFLECLILSLCWISFVQNLLCASSRLEVCQNDPFSPWSGWTKLTIKYVLAGHFRLVPASSTYQYTCITIFCVSVWYEKEWEVLSCLTVIPRSLLIWNIPTYIYIYVFFCLQLCNVSWSFEVVWYW